MALLAEIHFLEKSPFQTGQFTNEKISYQQKVPRFSKQLPKKETNNCFEILSYQTKQGLIRKHCLSQDPAMRAYVALKITDRLINGRATKII